MAVTLHYFTEFGKLALQKTICDEFMQQSIVFLVRVQYSRKESSRSLSHLLMSFLFPSAPYMLSPSTTRPRCLCMTGLGPCAVAIRLLQRSARRASSRSTVGVPESPERGSETRARPETT